MADVLKQLRQTQPAAAAQQQASTSPPSNAKPDNQPASPSSGRVSDSLSISEKDAVRRTVSACWNVDIGAKGVQDMKVEIRLQIGPDGTVQSATIEDTMRMMSDRAFRSFAESARRAVLQDRCKKLPLPPEKYDDWKDMVLTFSPRDML